MLKKVKSFYFIKNLFVYLDEKRKLKIMKYNKSFQKIINININNYIHFQRKYIIYNSKGKGKEYNGYNDKLVFEGEYLNGERNGKGKEYKDGKLRFEGEYLNGKKIKKNIFDSCIII